MSRIRVRTESARDRPVVHDVLAQAFPSDAEAKLVDILRGIAEPQISLVAENRAGDVMGHILFTPFEIRSPSSTSKAVGLGPMALFGVEAGKSDITLPSMSCRLARPLGLIRAWAAIAAALGIFLVYAVW